jgi:2,3-diketo-5-methylthiopentyl-1-phosphate enolase
MVWPQSLELFVKRPSALWDLCCLTSQNTSCYSVRAVTKTLISRQDLIQVTYRVLSDKLIDPEKKAKSIALGQTTDTWTPNAKSGMAKLEKHRGVVLGLDERTHVQGKPYEYFLTVGFPPANTEGDIPSLLTMIFGKISLDDRIRLESIELPAEFLYGKGPRHGVEGVRQCVGEPSKPLAMAIFKPCVGLSPAELGQMFFQLAAGGMHLIKDDEILPDLELCPTEKRLEACLQAAEKAARETGKRALYAVNLTGKPSLLPAKARRLAKLGAPCFLFNVLVYGYGALEELREVGVPIMAHPALGGAMGASANTGIAYSVLLGTLMRAGGADIVLFPSSYGTVALPPMETDAIREALKKPYASLRRTFPGPSAGIHPGLVPRILKDYGHDVIINAGGGVHGHPMGARAGAKAFRQAIDWCLTHRDFGGISERAFPELAAALRLWGRK